jgi:hypothetical protein
VLRPSSDAEGVVGAPFAAESYAPDYMPAGISIGVAAGVPLGEPACFWLPFQRGRARQGIEPAAHAEARVITGVRVSLPSHPASPGATMRVASVQSEAARAVERAGLITFEQAPSHVLDLKLDDARHHRTADLRPHLPLRLHW